MVWLTRYGIRHYIGNSICVFPILGLVAALVAVRILHHLDLSLDFHLAVDTDSARTVMSTLASAMFTCIALVSSALLVVVQLASAQLTPRIIPSIFRDGLTKFALTLFVFTFTLSLGGVLRIHDRVPALTATVAMYSNVASLAMLLYLTDHVGRKLRPGGALRGVVKSGRDVILSVYKHPIETAGETSVDPSEVPSAEPSSTFYCPRDGVVLAFDMDGLVDLATRHNCVIRMVPQVGDFVATGEPIFRVYGRPSSIPNYLLRTSIALGQERTLEQDPMLAFRILVDIAAKALSPAINDPTTAVIAIDQVHHLLRLVSSRNLEHGWVRDEKGVLRFLYPRPTWDDYVNLASTEIRQFGGTSIQVARRLTAMLNELIATVPPDRRPGLQRQLELLQKTCQRSFNEPEDRALALIGDFQGVGGAGRLDSPGPNGKEIPARSGTEQPYARA